MTTTAASSRTPAPPRRWPAVLVLAPAGLVLASGVLTGSVAGTATSIAVGIAATAVLALLAWVVGFSARLRPAREALLVLAALSVFGWASAAITAIPAVGAWLRDVPVPVAFLTTNALKLTAVVPLLLLATRLPGVRDRWLLRTGRPGAGTGVPHLRWPVLGPIVIVVVMALFLTSVPATAAGRLGAAAAWLPVMLLGSLVNAVCEELLYRHALIGAARTATGVVPAVVLSSLVFGLGHLTGNPGGLAGVAFTAVYGAVCALAMLRTKGMCWNVPIHVGGDLAIVLTLFLTSTRAI